MTSEAKAVALGFGFLIVIVGLLIYLELKAKKPLIEVDRQQALRDEQIAKRVRVVPARPMPLWMKRLTRRWNAWGRAGEAKRLVHMSGEKR